MPSSQDYQTVGELCISPNRASLAGTTFGASARSVLSPTNHTCQGNMAGYASHRRSLSPRPGPGAHRPSTVDNRASRLWIETQSDESIQTQRIQSRIKQLNFRLSGELPHETIPAKQLRQVIQINQINTDILKNIYTSPFTLFNMLVITRLLFFTPYRSSLSQ